MSSSLLDTAKKNANMAYKLDQSGQSHQAVRYYVAAAEQLQKLINFHDDPNMKNIYFRKAMEVKQTPVGTKTVRSRRQAQARNST